ncbi:MAG: hypothetical protein KY475_26115 [Planctomycetes bacterium]|nr:hypothetical protein [Planctomycetota bacterium]
MHRTLLAVACHATVLFGGLVAAADEPPAADDEMSALAIFEKRILPIFRSPKPSSCAECHLSGVDLKNYIDRDPRKTFAALVQSGLVDVQRPDDSKILEFIARKPEKPNLLTDEVRRQEYEAFRAWILAAVREPEMLAAKADAALLTSQPPVEVLRHGRKDRVLASFVENVWSEVNRCVHCHSPEFNRRAIPKFGQEFVDSITWIKPGDPAGTMERIVEAGLIDLDHPAESLLLTKPTVQVKHQGGQKMVAGDRGYRQFLRFAEDYAAIVRERYRTAAQLPRDSEEVALLSDTFLKIEGVPERYGRRVLHVELFPWDAARQAWSEQARASADWFINGKGRLWQSPLHLVARRDSEWAEQLESKRLPAGRYLAKLFIDRRVRLQDDPSATVGDYEPLSEVEFESDWPGGFANKTTIDFPEAADHRASQTGE